MTKTRMFLLLPSLPKLRALFAGSCLVLCSKHVQTQSPVTNYLPLPDPGYGLYYHDPLGSPNEAARWGYHDGWIDGRRDRNRGELSEDIKRNQRYMVPPEHGDHRGMMRDDFVKLYRAAYLHGYEHGFRL